MLASAKTWASFVKLSHTLFALPFALAAMAVAAREQRGWPGWRVFLLILAALVCARTCAMAFNRIVDRKFDAMNPRTANRHLPTGQISLAGAIALWAACGAGFVVAGRLILFGCRFGVFDFLLASKIRYLASRVAPVRGGTWFWLSATLGGLLVLLLASAVR